MWDFSLGSYLLGCATGIIVTPCLFRWLIRADDYMQGRRVRAMFSEVQGKKFIIVSGKPKPYVS